MSSPAFAAAGNIVEGSWQMPPPMAGMSMSSPFSKPIALPHVYPVRVEISPSRYFSDRLSRGPM